MEDFLKIVEQEHQAELIKMKLMWKGIKLEAAKEKIQHPDLVKEIDDYLTTIKSTLYNFIISLADSEDEKQDLHNDIKYVFEDEI